ARTSALISAWASDIFAGGLIIFISLCVLVLRIGVLLLLMLSPLILIVGVHPLGRPIVKRYFETLLGMALKQAMLLALMGIMLVIFRTVMQTPTPWQTKMILFVSLFIAVLLFWRLAKARMKAWGEANRNSAAGRIVGSVGADQTLSTVSGARTAVWARKKEREIADDLKPLVGAMIGGGLGGGIGGSSTTAKMPYGRNPGDAPNLNFPNSGDGDGWNRRRWTAEDVT